MNICLDTNVLIDILGKTEDFADSYAAFDVSIIRNFKVFIPITATTDIAYVLPRRNLVAKQQTMLLLSSLFELVEILDARGVDAKKALESTMEGTMPDYEDALLAQMALRNGIDLIITRNVKGFQGSRVPAVSPAQFLKLYKPKSIEYSIIDVANPLN